MIYCNEIEQTLFAPLPNNLEQSVETAYADLFFVYQPEADDVEVLDNSLDNNYHKKQPIVLPSLEQEYSPGRVLPFYFVDHKEESSQNDGTRQYCHTSAAPVQALFNHVISPCTSTTTLYASADLSLYHHLWVVPAPPQREKHSTCFFLNHPIRPKSSQTISKHYRIDPKELYRHHPDATNINNKNNNTNENNSPIRRKQKRLQQQLPP